MTLEKIISTILTMLAKDVKAGMTPKLLDYRAGQLIQKFGVESYNKGYKPDWASSPFPAYICVGVNDIIGHGIPDDRALKNGDLISIDLGIKREGKVADAALTVGVGDIAEKDKRLLYYARQAVYEILKEVKPGVSTETLANTCNRFLMLRGYRVNRRMGGHAIGAEMHQDPMIPHCPDDRHNYETLKAGQVICLEPMVTYGTDDFGVVLPDGWGIQTKDKKNSAFFEHMVKVTDTGYEVLTDHFSNVKLY